MLLLFGKCCPKFELIWFKYKIKPIELTLLSWPKIVALKQLKTTFSCVYNLIFFYHLHVANKFVTVAYCSFASYYTKWTINLTLGCANMLIMYILVIIAIGVLWFCHSASEMDTFVSVLGAVLRTKLLDIWSLQIFPVSFCLSSVLWSNLILLGAAW